MIDTETTLTTTPKDKPDLKKQTLLWYCLASAASAYLIVQGGAPTSVISLTLGGLFFALLLPLPHVLIALAFKSMRTWSSVAKIYRGWHKGLVTLCVVGFFAEMANNYMEQNSRIES